ncbi:MAG: DUF4760 domain-containing protein [Nitrosomonadales bacterium]|nr:DUF4760 domain-containing protein [Nitrosomonadales bacterium]
MSEVRPLVEFRFTLGIGVFVIIVGIIFISLFIIYPAYTEQLKFSAAVIGSMAAIFSTYYVAETLRLKLNFDRDSLEREKIRGALKFTYTDDPYISQIIQRLDKHLRIHSRDHGEISLDELRKFPNENYPEFKADIAYILGRLEVMCIAIKRDVVSEDVCIDLLLSRTVLYYDLFKQHIKDKQKTIGKDIYENFESTAIRWQGVRNELYKTNGKNA